MLIKIAILQAVFWGVLPIVLGFSLLSWQALMIILAGNIWFGIGAYLGGQAVSDRAMQYIDQHL